MISVFLSNLSSPPLLFFFLGVAAVVVRSDLEIPGQVAKALSLYLLFAIGFKGGVALSESSIDSGVVWVLLATIALSACIPVYVFFFIKKYLSLADSAATAATYGSVSAVTFVTAAGYLDIQGIEWSGYLVAAMALMESPAIIMGILLYNYYGRSDTATSIPFSWKQLLNEALFNGSVFLILGSMLIGWITGSAGMSQVEPVVKGLFLGLLCLFLLDMGIVAARRFKDFQHTGEGREGAPPVKVVVAAGLILPLFNAILGAGLAALLNLSEGDALLFVILVASGSYIAVPAAMRLALPEANPATYLTMSLAITFPFNLLIGIPTYHALIKWLL